ncbi:MAG: hypothetical protein ACRDNS_01890, partial [Trebonia sp.]
AVPRGLLGVLAGAGLGAAIGFLLLEPGRYPGFVGGRAAFLGAAIGILAALLAVGASFVEQSVPAPADRLGRTLRPAATALLPLAVLAPVAFLLCLAIRA